MAYDQLVREMGGGPATQLLAKLEFHPVFTAHPTEARRKAVEGKIRRISQLLGEHPRLAALLSWKTSGISCRKSTLSCARAPSR